MKDFWKNDLELFKKDLDAIFDFLFQPVTITTGDQLKLRPSYEEATEKVETSSFWKKEVELFNNEVELFKNDCKAIADFLTQPIEIK